MKIRTGFVSNSSSSSYIIAAPTGKVNLCEHCRRSDPNLFEEIERLSMDSFDTKVNSKKESVEYLKNELRWSLKEDIPSIRAVLDLVQKPPKGYSIRVIHLCYHDSASEYVFENAKGKYIIYDENRGYDNKIIMALQIVKDDKGSEKGDKNE